MCKILWLKSIKTRHSPPFTAEMY